MNEPEPLQQIGRTYVRVGGRRLSYFSGCDYFRLASHPRVVAALSEGVKKYGLNVAASRLTTGNHKLYVELEQRLARFFDAPSALVVSSGYVTNLIVAQALAGTFSHALLDEEAHPSLSDASRFLDCPVLRFRHRNPGDAARAVQRCGPGARLILLTDGMFSRDGSAAPLAEYLRVLPKDALMLVDDAHGAGVLGPTGRGILEHAGVGRARIIQTITLSKAFGVYGGAILGSKPLRQKILDCSRLFVGSTPPPLPLASAALESLRILETDSTLRQRLLLNAARVKTALSNAGLNVPDNPGPIIFIRPRRAADAARLSRQLLGADIYPPFLKYPNGPAGGYFRFVISSEHTRAQLHALIDVVARHARWRSKPIHG
jgi:8-amino-7-oxononanoate synthase